MKAILTFLGLFFVITGTSAPLPSGFPRPLQAGDPVRGWIILSDNLEEGLKVIERAPEYDINHLQLSHDIIHDLKHVRDPRRLKIARTLIRKAHDTGIQEVLVWDRALYNMDYYPERFRTGPGRTIDLDNPAFWEWFKSDYRSMLDSIPDIQGLIFTFIETGARAENQFSQKLLTNQEKLAAVVNAVADVVIGERGLNLYARTFSYTYEEYENITGAIELFKYDQIRLMMKETPHDFFLTHPNDFFAGSIARPTIIEFDTGAEFNGQGIIANTWPQHILERWSDFLKRDHVIGYAARTDRYGDTQIPGRPSEINLYALKRYFEDRQITAGDIYNEFITSRYGAEALPYIKAAFMNAFDIITSVLYTLGTNTANHSKLNYDPYRSTWGRHVSGKWLDPPVVYVKHGVNREFHYWKDVVSRLAPAWAKAGGTQLEEVPWVVENQWLSQGELMDETFLDYIITEKQHGVALTLESLEQVEKAKPFLTSEQYHDLFHYFNRTLLTAQLHEAVAAAYFGYRIYARGEHFRTPSLIAKVDHALHEMVRVAEAIKEYPVKTPAGQWNWVEDAVMALQYHEWITEGSWPEKTQGYPTGLNGIVFPFHPR